MGFWVYALGFRGAQRFPLRIPEGFSSGLLPGVQGNGVRGLFGTCRKGPLKTLPTPYFKYGTVYTKTLFPKLRKIIPGTPIFWAKSSHAAFQGAWFNTGAFHS